MRSTGRLGLVVAVALLLLPAVSAGTPGSGLHGVVKKGPIKPVCRAGEPCDAPAQVTLTFSSTTATNAGAMLTFTTKLRTDKHGRYRVALPPGFYTVSTGRVSTIGKPIKPHAVHVRSGHWDRINFFIDTGIR
jgi:hypothetical protein